MRKRMQMLLLQHVVRERQAQFNKEVEKVKTAKDQFIDRVREINTRMMDICEELKIDPREANGGEALFEPRMADGETEVDALTVRPEEIKAEKWLTAEERKATEERIKAEEARRREMEGDTPAARALRQMFGGVLQTAKDDREGAPDKPTFMDRVPKEQWTEEQLRAAKDFEAREKVYQEEREKRAKGLEVELKKLRLEVGDVIAAFNASVAALGEERWAAAGAVAELELQICCLAVDVDRATRAEEAEEGALVEAVAAQRRVRTNAMRRATDFKREHEMFTEVVEAMSNEDKALEKNFRREFAEAGMEYYEDLVKLYKRRGPRPADADASIKGATVGGRRVSVMGPRRVSQGAAALDSNASNVRLRMRRASQYGKSLRRSSAGFAITDAIDRWHEMDHLAAHPRDPFGAADASIKAAPAAVVSVHPILDQPEGLDQWIWNRFLECRNEKLASEERFSKQRMLQEEQAKYLSALLDEAESARVTLGDLDTRLRELRERRARSVYDLEVPTRIKQGQVELPVSSLGIDTDDAVLVHRRVVEALNAEVRRQGKLRVDALTHIKDFKSDIYGLQWENRRADMEIEDLAESGRALQLLRLPKNYQQLEGKVGDATANDELASVERRVAFGRKEHARRTAEVQKKIERMQQQAAQIRNSTEGLKRGLTELEEDVIAQRRIQERTGGDLKAEEQAAVTRRRMRGVVTRRQLVDIAKGQAGELDALKKELHRLRLRTYPSFVEAAPPGARAPAPDTKPGLSASRGRSGTTTGASALLRGPSPIGGGLASRGASRRE